MSLNILLVDDERDILDSLTYLLESEGYNVYIGTNQAEAEKIVNEKDVNYAILDYVLVDITGVQLAKILHKKNENIKFMFFSGHPDVSNIKNVLGFNVYEVFLKPIDPDTFLEKLRKIVTSNCGP